MNRVMDGIFYRVKRDGKYESICYSDLTLEEKRQLLPDDYNFRAINDHLMNKLMQVIEYTDGYGNDQRKISEVLADSLKEIGDKLNLMGE